MQERFDRIYKQDEQIVRDIPLPKLVVQFNFTKSYGQW